MEIKRTLDVTAGEICKAIRQLEFDDADSREILTALIDVDPDIILDKLEAMTSSEWMLVSDRLTEIAEEQNEKI